LHVNLKIHQEGIIDLAELCHNSVCTNWKT